MLLAQIVGASGEVAATRSRKAKVEVLAAALAAAPPEEREVAASYLAGSLLQRRTGVGWRGVPRKLDAADEPRLTLTEVHEAFERLAALSGPGSQSQRAAEVANLFGSATTDEQRWLGGVITGGVRQGALDALLQEALAKAASVPLTAVRRAAMLAGGTVPVVTVAFDRGEEGLAEVGLEVGRPVLPMLAASAPDLTAAFAKLSDRPVAVETKLDGIRIQVHRRGDDVVVATRSLDEITHRLPEVVEAALSLPSEQYVLDGEALALDDQGRPRAFQDTASRTAQAGGVAVTPYFFDILHLDGTDLLDEPGARRQEALVGLVPERWRVPRLVTDDAEAAESFATDALTAGHEGVVVKTLTEKYAAGRRGAGWIKVKPVHTLDLVVLAVEWGSGRRQGWLSNIHLGARDADTGELVMLGKTFKGMTDAMLAWQTERFTELAIDRERIKDSYVVEVRPEQVVEIAFDGVQRSTRYGGGVALRFARVVRYRDDKTPAEADTIQTVRSYLRAADG